MKVSPKGAFLRNLKKLSNADRESTISALELFVVDPRHHSLNFEALTARRPYFTIRANLRVRVLLRKIGEDAFDIVAVGNHDYVYASYFKK